MYYLKVPIKDGSSGAIVDEGIIVPYEAEGWSAEKIGAFVLDMLKIAKRFEPYLEYLRYPPEGHDFRTIIDFWEFIVRIEKEEQRKEAIKQEKARQKQLREEQRQKLLATPSEIELVRTELRRKYTQTFYKLGRRDGFRCKNCGSVEKLEIDHIVPVILGGTNKLENLQFLCSDCNGKKSDILQIDEEGNIEKQIGG
jgi:5-methylcytosine-specific restriction endonuclease McrA